MHGPATIVADVALVTTGRATDMVVNAGLGTD
jgi:hypothetical protein